MAGKSSSNIGIFVLLGIVAVAIALFVMLYQPSHNWTPTLRTTTSGPYDLTVFQALLDSSTTERLRVTDAPVTESLDTTNDVNYFFVGGYPYLDSAQAKALFDFIERGNTAVIVSSQFSDAFYEELNQHEIWLGNQDWTLSESIFPRTNRAKKKHRYAYKGAEGENNIWWSFMQTKAPNYLTDSTEEEVEEDTLIESFFDDIEIEEEEFVEEDTTYWNDDEYADEADSTEWEDDDYDDYYEYDRVEGLDTAGWSYFEPLGYYTNDGGSDTTFQNFFRAKIGEGQLILHINPILFTNYFLLNEDGFEYTNEALAYIDNKQVIWDGYHQYYRPTMNEYPKSETPLRFIFENPPLKYAWLTLVFSTFLFLIFRTKREQNIIPIIPAIENTSIAFAKSLGILYHQAKSGRFLAVELMRMFDNFNRRHYGINRDRKDEHAAILIAKKSRIDEQKVREILLLELKIVYNPISKISEVVILYNHLEDYYKNARK